MKQNQELIYRFCGGLSGLLLAFGNMYPKMALIQLLAFLPVFYVARTYPKKDVRFVVGLYMGLAFSIPQLISLKMHVVVTLILLVYYTLISILINMVVPLIFKLKRNTLLTLSAFFVVIDWVNITLIPFWGTSQSFIRGWSEYPYLVLFASYTGITGVIFVLTGLQAAIIFGINSEHRKSAIMYIIILLCIVTLLNISVILDKPTSQMTVAAVGWTFDDSHTGCEDPHTMAGFDNLFAAPAVEAAEKGARVLISGEIGFYIPKFERDLWLERFRHVARENNLYLIVGYANDDMEDKLFFMNPKGEVEGEYLKTFLTPYEPFLKGRGDLKVFQCDSVRLGGMICQDDNFPQLSREYGRKHVSIVAAPTADWDTVRFAHLQTSVWRAIECRYAVIRGAANGISAIISPLGVIQKKCDHFKQGAGLLVSSVPIYDSTTLFSRFGHWIAWVCIGLLFGVSINALRLK